MPAPLLVKPTYQEVGWHTKNNLLYDRVNGLRNVDDTADADKPVSTATQTALDTKSSTSHTHTKSDVGLANVNNTSDANKPISTATQAALDLKSDTSHTHAGYAASSHTHTGYAAESHTHSQSDVTGLSSALSGKSDTGHTHSYAATSHSHAGGDITSGTVDIARLPTGTSGTTVALGNHTHAAYAATTTTDSLADRLTVLEKPNVSLTDASTVAINAALGTRFKVTIAGNRTLGNPTNAYDGQVLLINVKQDGTGSRTVTLDTKYRLPTGITLTWSTAAGKKDKLLVQYDSTDDKFDVLAFQAGY